MSNGEGLGTSGPGIVGAYGSGSPPKITVMGSGLVQSHNLLTNSPGWMNAGGSDFRLTSGSPAIDAGYAVTVLKDRQGNGRVDVSGVPDTARCPTSISGPTRTSDEG